MIPCVSQAVTLSTSFLDDLAAYAQAGCWHVELWLPKLEEQLKEHDLDHIKQQVADLQLFFPVAAPQGGLVNEVPAVAQESMKLLERRLPLLRALGVRTLVVPLDFGRALDAQQLARAMDRLRQAAERAAEYGVRLALEFQGRGAFGNNLETAVQLVEELGTDNVGVCLDVFHFYTGPSKLADLELLTVQNLFHVQLCDVAGLLREVARDSDRILPGEGDWDVGPIVERLRAIGYEGPVSVELFNPVLWQMDARQVAEVAITSLRRVLGLASMGRTADAQR